MAELSDEAREAAVLAYAALDSVTRALGTLRHARGMKIAPACDDLHRAVDKLRCEVAALTAAARPT